MDPLSLLQQFLAWIVPSRWSAAWYVVIVLLPFGITSLAFAVVNRVSHQQFFRVPLVYGLTAVVGLCAGLSLTHVRPEAGHEATLASILRVGGPWDISPGGFLLEIVNPLVYRPMGVVDAVLAPNGAGALQAIVVVGLAGLAAVIALTFAMWRLAEVGRALAAAAIVAVWATLLSVYLISLTYWSVAQLNFWAIAVLLLIIQYLRTHPHQT